VRNNSEGSVPVGGITVGPVMPLHQGGPFYDAAAAAGAAAGNGDSGAYGRPLSSIPSGVSISGASGEAGLGPAAAAAGEQQQPGHSLALSPTKHHGGSSKQGSSAAGPAAAAAAAGGTLALSSQPVLELVVRNASERYFR
jgi:hypothetical protein